MNTNFRAEQRLRLDEMRNFPEPTERWPRGCRGSRRAWLVFIGPSPGGRGAIDEEASPRWNTPFTDPFERSETRKPWGGGFPRSMPALLLTLMPEASERERPFLYAVYNFDSVQNSQASGVLSTRMKQGAPAVLSLLEHFPPRLIVPMETRCFEQLKDTLRQRGYDFETHHEFPTLLSIYDNPKRFHRKISGFRIRGAGPLNESVVVKLPQHPAKMMRADYAAKCGEAVRELFERLIKAA